MGTPPLVIEYIDMWNRTIQSMASPPEPTFSAMALSVSLIYMKVLDHVMYFCQF